MGIFKKLIALGITVGLADRQTFVKNVSGIIEDYQENPEKAEEWAQIITKFLEEMKEDIRTQQNIESANASNLPNENIEQLTKAVQELTKQLQQQKK